MNAGLVQSDALNPSYSVTCEGLDDDAVPDCGHEHCGLLCDDKLLAERLEKRQAGGRERSLNVAHLRAEGLLLAGRQSYSEVARRTGLSHQTVARLGKPMGQLGAASVRSSDHDDSIADLHAEGFSVRAIAHRLGVSKSTVARRVSQPVQREGAA
jgi:DNA invertase Pin-like site-specific DNA recombinase